MTKYHPQNFTYPCGCVNRIDPEWGILRSVSKCASHLRHAGKTGMAHYLDMKCIVGGVPQHAKYAEELDVAMVEINRLIFPAPTRDTVALEIGCGLAMYAPKLLNLGYKYYGIEPDAAAAHWARMTFCVPICQTTFEDATGYFMDAHFTGAFPSLVLAAHVIEHVTDAPAVLASIFQLVKPPGRLILIVPDDRDPVNPDHLWFFTMPTLRTTLERIGFTDVQMVSKSIVKHENFIYCSAVKP